ncbi:kiwellin-like [Syzygium oleosum]|uniref:kiwellin-like n=1 Tax=Syzygium oleosum TaxID=219896 RepID=UPI0011D204B0|nr:kiwellin-like [Syzygium oleosum]
MKYFGALLLALPIVISITLFSSPSHAISSCNGPCQTLDDCAGQLICINGRCHDDPDVGTHTCPNTPSPSGGGCRPSGTMHCHGQSYPKYGCSPLVTSSTRATLTNNDFSRGGGSGVSECDGRFHKNSELIVALSTGWYAGGSRCGDRIKITSTKTGRSVMAKVVDECDSMNGCDGEHDDDLPCGNDIVDGSNAVWHALGLDIELGEEDVTWSMA